MDETAIDALMAAGAAANNLPVDPAFYDGVRINLVRTAAIAKLVTEFDLPDAVEAAPVFRP
jgi:hypothetical protein